VWGLRFEVVAREFHLDHFGTFTLFVFNEISKPINSQFGGFN
jgi:hypothetical protein